MDGTKLLRDRHSMIQILVIARNNSAGNAYLTILERNGMTGVLASETQAVLHALRTLPLQGLVVNMPTYLRLQGRGKHVISEALACYPVLRCRADNETGVITVFDQGHESPETAFAGFAATCAHATPRTIRRSERIWATCSILLARESSFAPAATERTITMNASEQGAFCFSVAHWQNDDPAWLQFLDLDDKTPIVGKVIHAQRWGKGCRMPGCGVEFTSITDAQREQLAAVLAGAHSFIGKSYV